MSGENPLLVDREFRAPKELDLFALETKSRKTISELIRPVIADMDIDRRKMAEVAVTMGGFIERVEKLEYMLKVSSKKPKVFMDIENKFADIKVSIAQNRQELKNTILNVSERQAMIKD